MKGGKIRVRAEGGGKGKGKGKGPACDIYTSPQTEISRAERQGGIDQPLELEDGEG